jgi:hypothetical protein
LSGSVPVKFSSRALRVWNKRIKVNASQAFSFRLLGKPEGCAPGVLPLLHRVGDEQQALFSSVGSGQW